MGKPTGFLEFTRRPAANQPVAERLRHFDEFVVMPGRERLGEQAARCLDCGIPYCQNGCPVDNLIPDWNDLVYRDDWRAAAERLHATNNFPEFTGRVCPAPCEAACTLNLQDAPVSIKLIERAIIDRAFAENWVTPRPAETLSGRSVAVVGGGPAGLACAQQLARAGHQVDLYDRQPRAGGLLRYGIPDFKLDKALIDRRLKQLEAEGVTFHCGVEVGRDVAVDALRDQHDALVLAGGCEDPRDLDCPGRELARVHQAMDYLRCNNHAQQDGTEIPQELNARGRQVVVIGGGDTGSDCIGTALRQGASSVVQIEIMSQPPEREDQALTWPNWPHKLRTSTSQEEGCERLWDIATDGFIADKTGNAVAGLNCHKVAWDRQDGQWRMRKVPDSEFVLEADFVTLALGFVRPRQPGLLESLNPALDDRSNVAAPTTGAQAYQTNLPGVFAAGDMRRGQSLVVWAIREGRQCAAAVDGWLINN